MLNALEHATLVGQYVGLIIDNDLLAIWESPEVDKSQIINLPINSSYQSNSSVHMEWVILAKRLRFSSQYSFNDNILL